MDGPIIFISYRRRGVDLYVATELHERLGLEFGTDRIFLDTEAIPLGTDWRAFIDRQLSRSAVMLAIIGPTWVQEQERLRSESDQVRYELAKAMADPKITVIPLLIDGTDYPTAADLPADLSSLPGLNGTELVQRYFNHIVNDRLIPSLRSLLAARSLQQVEQSSSPENMSLDSIRSFRDPRQHPEVIRALAEFRKNRGSFAGGILDPKATSKSVRPTSTEVQQRLKDLGFNPGEVDGRFGPQTWAAIFIFQSNNGLKTDGVLGPKTLAALFEEN